MMMSGWGIWTQILWQFCLPLTHNIESSVRLTENEILQTEIQDKWFFYSFQAVLECNINKLWQKKVSKSWFATYQGHPETTDVNLNRHKFKVKTFDTMPNINV